MINWTEEKKDMLESGLKLLELNIRNQPFGSDENVSFKQKQILEIDRFISEIKKVKIKK